MASLTNTKIKVTYGGLLKTTDNNALGGTYKLITDGLGNSSGVYLGMGGNVGIGTNQPQTLLQLNNNNSSTNAEQGAISFAGDTASRYSQISGFRFNNSNQAGLDFKVYNGALNNAIRITNYGDVGIGTTDPKQLLHIASTSAQSVITLQRTNSGTTGAIGALQWTALDNHTVASMVALADGDDNGADITFNTTSDASSDNPYGISERMRIDSSGNVGIGTPDPSTKLHVYESNSLDHITIDGNNGKNRNLRFATENSTRWNLYATGTSETGSNVGSDLSIAKYTDAGAYNGNVLMIKRDTGDVRIGTDSSAGGGKLTVDVGAISGTLVSFQNTQNLGGSITIVSGGGTSFNSASDYRLKENVVDMTGALDRIEQLQPKRFNFISDTEKTVDGFIAHEVQSVIPEAITGEKDAVDDEGNPEYQGIDQSKIVPLLVGAIKELKSEIETLKTQINS